MTPVLNDETTNGITIEITECIAKQLAQYEYDIFIKNNKNFLNEEKEKYKEKLKKDFLKDVGKEIILDISILNKINIRC